MPNLETDEELRNLYKRCSGGGGIPATEKDWTDLYQLILSILSKCNAPILGSLQLSRHDYINEYFTERVLTKLPKNSANHCGALINYFKCFLIEKYREEKKIREEEIFDDSHNYEDEDDNHVQDKNDETVILKDDCNSSIEIVSQSASEFIDNLKSNPKLKWAWLMLRYHYFQDKDDQMPMDALARQYQISAYAYKAGQLGFNHQFERGVNHFEKTLLGDWLKKTLKLEKITLENMSCISACLKILGFITLSKKQEKF